MLFANLDTITRGILLKKSLPLHYYCEILYHVSSAVRILSTDSLKIINTVKLPITSYNSIEIPDDFVDDVLVGIGVGDRIQKLPKKNLNPILNHDSSGNFVGYSTAESEPGAFFYGYPGWLWNWNVNDFGEPTGRYFGVGGGTASGYAVFKDQNRIQLTNMGLDTTEAVLVYISDGQSADAATKIDKLAIDAIEAFANWKRGFNADNEHSPEGNAFYNQRRLYRARSNDLTITDIKQIVRENYHASIKN